MAVLTDDTVVKVTGAQGDEYMTALDIKNSILAASTLAFYNGQTNVEYLEPNQPWLTDQTLTITVQIEANPT